MTANNDGDASQGNVDWARAFCGEMETAVSIWSTSSASLASEMGQVVTFPKADDLAACFGGCPRCRCVQGPRNVGREQWFYCEEHRYKWCAGENLVSSWREEEPLTWARNTSWLAA